MTWTTKLMVNGVWKSDVPVTPELDELLERHLSDFRGVVSPSGNADFPAEKARYRLYVSYACPFAHRVILAYVLKSLDEVIGLSFVHPRWNGPHGWCIEQAPVQGPTTSARKEEFIYLYQLYAKSSADYTGRVTTPVLWDEATGRIVSNESLDIIRMLNTAFDDVGADGSVDLYPADLRDQIDWLQPKIVHDVAGCIYEIGAVDAQAEYDVLIGRLFAALDSLELHLSRQSSFLHGRAPTLNDILLFPSLVRFDCVYHPLFRLGRRRLAEYADLSAWMLRMLDVDGIAETVRLREVMKHYYDGWAPRNDRIVPELPQHLSPFDQKSVGIQPSLAMGV
jgi:putative glutathione S-transferase